MSNFTDWFSQQVGKATWGRWIPGAAAQLEGGVDVPEPAGTPIYALGSGALEGRGYFYHGGPFFSTSEFGAGSNPGFGVVTEDVPGVGQVYYQHIDLASGLPFCQSGSCNGQQVQAGQLLGYSRANPGEVEVGINSTWGGIWGTNTNASLWPDDPRPALMALSLRSSNTNGGTPEPPPPSGTGGTNPLCSSLPPSLAFTLCGILPPTQQAGQTVTSQACQPWDISCLLGDLGPLIQKLLLVTIGLILVVIGLVVLFKPVEEKAITYVMGQAKEAAKMAEFAA